MERPTGVLREGERGFGALNPLLRYSLVALAVAALFFAHRVIVKHEAAKAFQEGTIQERVEWLARESKELVEKNQQILDLQNRYRALERKNADDVAAAAAVFNKEIQRVQTQRDAAIRDRNAFRLRWTTSCAPRQADGGNPAPATGAPTAASGGTATCELPEQARADLIREAARANQVVAERNALLEIAKKDREVCK